MKESEKERQRKKERKEKKEGKRRKKIKMKSMPLESSVASSDGNSLG